MKKKDLHCLIKTHKEYIEKLTERVNDIEYNVASIEHYENLSKMVISLENRVDELDSMKEASKIVDDVFKEKFKLPDYLDSYEKWKDFLKRGILFGHFWLMNICKNKKTYAFIKLQYIADELNGDWVTSDGYNWAIGPTEGQINAVSVYYYTVAPLFETREKAEKAIEIMGDDIKYIFGVNNERAR